MFLTSQTTCHYQVVPLHMLACYLYRTDPLLASGTVVFSVAAADQFTASHTVRKDKCDHPQLQRARAIRKDTRGGETVAVRSRGQKRHTRPGHAAPWCRRAIRKDTRDGETAAVRSRGQKRHTRPRCAALSASVRSKKTHTNPKAAHQMHLRGWHYFLIPRALVISTCRELACDRSCMHSARSFGKKCLKSDCALKDTKSTSPW